MNALKYLQSKTQIDLDSFDLEGKPYLTISTYANMTPAARKGGPDGPWTDATSNPAEVYTQIIEPKNADIVKEAITISRKIHAEFSEVTEAELRVEVAVRIFLIICPHIG